QDPAGLPMGVTSEGVPHVVQVTGDAGELRLTLGEAEPMQDLVSDLADEVGVPEAVLGVPHRIHHAVRRRDVQRELGIVLDILEGDARDVRWGGLRGGDLRNGRALGCSDGVGLAHDRIGPAAFSSGPSSGGGATSPASSSSSSSTSASSSMSSSVSRRAIPARSIFTRVPAAISTVTVPSSSSSSTIVPKIPDVVRT